MGLWGPDPVVRGLFTRVLTFQTPVKSRMVKKSLVDVQQTQRCQLRTPTELWISTSNSISGVPYSEDFTVESKWRLTAESELSTRLEVWLDMAWGPHPPMEITRVMIEKSSLGGAGLMFENYAKLARVKLQRIANPRAHAAGEDEKAPEPLLPEPVGGAKLSDAAYVHLLCVSACAKCQSLARFSSRMIFPFTLLGIFKH